MLATAWSDVYIRIRILNHSALVHNYIYDDWETFFDAASHRNVLLHDLILLILRSSFYIYLQRAHVFCLKVRRDLPVGRLGQVEGWARLTWACIMQCNILWTIFFKITYALIYIILVRYVHPVSFILTDFQCECTIMLLPVPSLNQVLAV